MKKKKPLRSTDMETDDSESENLENDIVVENLGNTFHLLNSISPSWTCSFKTASYLIEKIKEIINL